MVHPGLFPLLPVLSSTAMASYAIAKYPTLIPFFAPDMPPKVVARWMNRWFRLGSIGIIGLEFATGISGFIARRQTTGFASVMYGYGAAFALGHFVFAPWLAPTIQRVCIGPEDETRKQLIRFFKIHTLRTFLADVPAALCFVLAYLHTTSS